MYIPDDSDSSGPKREGEERGSIPLRSSSDPFLGDYLMQFSQVLEALKAAEGPKNAQASESLCELSRRILLRTVPAEDCHPSQVREAISLFREAIRCMKASKEEPRVAGFCDSISERLEELTDAHERSSRSFTPTSRRGTGRSPTR